MDKTEMKKALPSILGMALLWPSLLSNFRYPLSADSSTAVQPLLIVYAITLLLLSIAIVLAHRSFDRILFGKRLMLTICGLLGLAGSFLVNYFGNLGVEALPIALAALGVAFLALYTLFFFQYWSAQLTAQGSHYLLFALISCAISSLFNALRLSIGLDETSIYMALPLAQVVLVLLCKPEFESPPSTAQSVTIKNLHLEFLGPSLVFIYLCTAGITMSNSGFFTESGPPEHLLYRSYAFWFEAVLMAAICVVLWRMPDSAKAFAGLFGLFTTLLVAASLLAVPIASLQTNMASLCFIVGLSLFESFGWLILLYAVKTSRASATLVFSLFTIIAIALPKLIRTLVTLNAGRLSDTPDVTTIFAFAAMISLLAVAIVVFSFFYYMRQEIRQASERRGIKQSQAVAAAGAAHGLSEREVDIISYTYRGYNAKHIAGVLYIAESTVYTHLKRIYRKLGIHSKQDLIQLIDSFK
jgi:DNA-binding CsgD family transcriptional regulator